MSGAKPDILLTHSSAPQMVPTLEQRFTVHLLTEAGDRDAFVAAVRDRIRALVMTTFAGADARLIDALPNLEFVINAGGHYDNSDVGAIRARGLPMAYTPGVTTEDVADTVIALLAATARRICDGDRFVRAGRWHQGAMGFGARLNGKPLGIVGLGRIGRAVATRAAAFDMEIHYHGPRRKNDVPYRYHGDITGLARSVAFLAVTCRSGPETRRIVGRRVFEALGPGGMIASVARGAIDEAALIEALEAGRIGGAALDVFENEPDPPEALLAMENVVLTPHIGSAAKEAKQAMVELVLANLDAHFAGEPLPTPAPHGTKEDADGP